MGSVSALSEELSVTPQQFADGAALLEGFVGARDRDLYRGILAVSERAPFRNMSTTRGYSISAAMTNCGNLGWWSDRSGYRYAELDPDSGRPWPPMPAVFLTLAQEAAQAAGYEGFLPNACLINRYAPGLKMGLHQDKDEGDFEQPIVSVSLGLDVNFLFGGLSRAEKRQRIPLTHGDVVVFGGASRLNFHGVGAVRRGEHPLTGPYRYNLTFRYVAPL